MRLRSGRIVKDHRTTEEEESNEESLIQGVDGEESPDDTKESRSRNTSDPEEETNISQEASTTNISDNESARDQSTIIPP